VTMPATTSKRSIPFRRQASVSLGLINNRLYSLSVYDAGTQRNDNVPVSYRGRRLNLEKFRENLKREKKGCVDSPLIIAQIDDAQVTLRCGLSGSYHSKGVVREAREIVPTCSMPLQLSPQSE